MLVGRRPRAGSRWMVLVEQPTREAFAVARRRNAISSPHQLALLHSCCSPAWSGAVRSSSPSAALILAPRRSRTGASTGASLIRSKSELGRLGDAFTGWRAASRAPGGRRRQGAATRCSPRGRGPRHDLSHPFKNIQNTPARGEDARRSGVPGAVQANHRREFAQIKRVFEDSATSRGRCRWSLPVDLNSLAGDVAESMPPTPRAAGWPIELELAPGELYVEGDCSPSPRLPQPRDERDRGHRARRAHHVGTAAADGRATLRVADTWRASRADRLERCSRTATRQAPGAGAWASRLPKKS